VLFAVLRDTECHVRYEFKDGAWDNGEEISNPFVTLHIMSGILHYGQSLFEGLKVCAHGVRLIVAVLSFGGANARSKDGCKVGGVRGRGSALRG
jgi:hypothetical protein